jgi:hypothetical protein
MDPSRGICRATELIILFEPGCVPQGIDKLFFDERKYVVLPLLVPVDVLPEFCYGPVTSGFLPSAGKTSRAISKVQQ